MTSKNATQTVTYTADFVYKMVKEGKLVIPDFQRRYWWPIQLQVALINTILGDRFVLPMFLFKYAKTGIDELGDGQQRVTTICKFINNEFGLDKAWCEIPELSGRYFKDLSEEHKNKVLSYYLSFATAIADDMTDDEKVQVFVDLNPKRTGIKYQEIRNAKFGGPYNNFLKKMAEEGKFKMLFNIPGEHPRMDDAEAVLAFLAELEGALSWQGLQRSLSKFMAKERLSVGKMEDKDRLEYLADLREKFKHGVDASFAVFGKDAFKARKIRSNTPVIFNMKYFVTFMVGFQKYSLPEITFHKDEIRKKINEWIATEPETWHGHESTTNSSSGNRRMKFEEIVDGIIHPVDVRGGKATA